MDVSKFKIFYINQTEIDARESGFEQKRLLKAAGEGFLDKFELVQQLNTTYYSCDVSQFGFDINPLLQEDKVFFSKNPSEIGRFLTHLVIWNNFIKSDLEYIVVLENYHCIQDAVLLLHDPLKVGEDDELIDLSKRRHPYNMAYMLTRKGCKKLLTFANDPTLLSECSLIKKYGNQIKERTVITDIFKFINLCTEKEAGDSLSTKRMKRIGKVEDFLFLESKTPDEREAKDIVKSDFYKFWQRGYRGKEYKYNDKILILFLCTNKEVLSGQLEECLSRLLTGNISENHSFDILISTNVPCSSPRIMLFENHHNVNSIKFASVDIKPEDDVFLYEEQIIQEQLVQTKQIPILGFTSGPNKLFFETMLNINEGKFKNYKDILMLEADCRNLTYNWMDTICKYCRNNKFVIAGSRYRGNRGIIGPMIESWTGHLNGVGIYRTGEDLQFLLEGSMQYIAGQVQAKKEYYVNFDTAIHLFSQSLAGVDRFWPSGKPSKFIDSPIISNFSPELDSMVSINGILENYPDTCIVHQKI